MVKKDEVNLYIRSYKKLQAISHGLEFFISLLLLSAMSNLFFNQRLEVFFLFTTCRTLFGRCFALVDVAAISASPFNNSIAFKDFPFRDKFCKFQITKFMMFFCDCNRPEHGRNFQESFFFCDRCKIRLHLCIFVIFTCSSCFEILHCCSDFTGRKCRRDFHLSTFQKFK